MFSNAKTISISGAALKNNKVDVGHHQGPVVQKVNSAIHRINHYPEWITQLVSLILIHSIVIYQVDSTIQLLSNWGLI